MTMWSLLLIPEHECGVQGCCACKARHDAIPIRTHVVDCEMSLLNGTGFVLD